jgi:hypothetical protein
MPFDGRESAVTEALDRLTTFFSDESHWYHEEFCKRRGQHSYQNGQMCLGGAVMAEIEKGVPVELQVCIEAAIECRFRMITSLNLFNRMATHKGLLAVLTDAKRIALYGSKTTVELAARHAEWDKGKSERQRKAEAERQKKQAAAEREGRFGSMLLLASMEPTAVLGRETGLIADMTAFFDDPKSRPCGPKSGVKLGQVMNYFRKARGLRGDNTASYLRRAFRGMAWTFGSIKAFDSRANRLEILNVLRRARELAEADIFLARVAGSLRVPTLKRAA